MAGISIARICPKCGTEHQRNHSYCFACHAAQMRAWRKTHKPTPEQRFKDSCRSYAGVYNRRGYPALARQPCLFCGGENSQMHHIDYTKPLSVFWFCRECHLTLHKVLKG
jgi:hypothetical protein